MRCKIYKACKASLFASIGNTCGHVDLISSYFCKIINKKIQVLFFLSYDLYYHCHAAQKIEISEFYLLLAMAVEDCISVKMRPQ